MALAWVTCLLSCCLTATILRSHSRTSYTVLIFTPLYCQSLRSTMRAMHADSPTANVASMTTGTNYLVLHLASIDSINSSTKSTWPTAHPLHFYRSTTLIFDSDMSTTSTSSICSRILKFKDSNSTLPRWRKSNAKLVSRQNSHVNLLHTHTLHLWQQTLAILFTWIFGDPQKPVLSTTTITRFPFLMTQPTGLKKSCLNPRIRPTALIGNTRQL